MSTENPKELLPELFDTGPSDALVEKLADAMTPGFVAECDPIEAERAGAFAEDAMSEADALASSIDLNRPAG
ncbi:hypothetical protein GCM10027277_57630 [Pseudoduganella ginsengisoli]|uniref:Conjugal transfer protein TraD n=1 Tax=Pseudoduganella ginsengisoli TaxID=1462440 RepID=A0A6L6Q7R1_9BURK|nr:hypothetical protein [Pseudoduganella ginsengisoli]MTW05873.1 hypothetical protein [Pseudoduganella ginsengisoli]